MSMYRSSTIQLRGKYSRQITCNFATFRGTMFARLCRCQRNRRLLLRRRVRLLAEQPERPGDHGKCCGVCRKRSENRRVQTAEQTAVPFSSYGFLQAIQSSRVTIVAFRLYARLDHVNGIGYHPGGGAGETTGQQHVNRRDRLLRGRRLRQHFVSHEVDAVTRSFPEKRDTQSPKDAAITLSLVDVSQASQRSVRITPG